MPQNLSSSAKRRISAVTSCSDPSFFRVAVSCTQTNLLSSRSPGISKRHFGLFPHRSFAHCLFRLPFLSLWFSLCLIQLETKGAVLIIYTESDYLEAHLTEISHDSRNWSDAIDAVPHLITDALKKFAHSDADNNSSSKPRSPKFRTR